jgi:hypothetical protein
VPGPVKEARRLQAAAIAHNKYPNYQQASIVGTTFRTWPAARWTFLWQSATAANPTKVIALLFTVQTWEGPQQFVLTISAPQPRVAWEESIFSVVKRTFKPLPRP